VNGIKAVALDVDGVLTDGTFVWGPNGEEYKSFSFADVMGVSMGRKAGLIFALISGEDSPLVERFAQKMGIVDIYKGCKDKASALSSFAEKYHLDMSEICFMGDDINDVTAMDLAGLASAPATAHKAALNKAKLVMRSGGGRGAVRELLDLILSNKTGEPA
jgi:3-deoxy-D-manno-octulosonate 8-phosphate phosphatase (KDO 8-P phosphatase)